MNIASDPTGADLERQSCYYHQRLLHETSPFTTNLSIRVSAFASWGQEGGYENKGWVRSKSMLYNDFSSCICYPRTQINTDAICC